MMEKTIQTTVSPSQGVGDSVIELRGGSKITVGVVSVQKALIVTIVDISLLIKSQEAVIRLTGLSAFYKVLHVSEKEINFMFEQYLEFDV